MMTDQFYLSFVPEEQAKEYFEANRRVLVIEDDKVLSQMIEDILDDAGFEVVTAANWMVASRQLRQHPVDFMLLDLLLPDTDGFEIYKQLQNNPDTKDMPVLIVTAWADEHNLAKADQLGIKHVLPKPFTEDELLIDILTLLADSAHQAK